jgi:hypothetical protein
MKQLMNKNKESTAYNVRFCEMAALAPQKRQCELGSYYPAASLVKPPPRKAAGTLADNGGQNNPKICKKQTGEADSRKVEALF